jgi:hypothetical protein
MIQDKDYTISEFKLKCDSLETDIANKLAVIKKVEDSLKIS